MNMTQNASLKNRSALPAAPVLDALGAVPRIAAPNPSILVKPLTRIERALLQALRTGASNKALARQLGKSSHTVRNQLSALFMKIGVGNRIQALVWLQTHAVVADFGVTDWPPVSSDRSFGTSVLLPGSGVSVNMAHAQSLPAIAADSLSDPYGAAM